MVGHPRSRQAALRGDKTVDPPPRPLMAADVEGGQFGEELQLAVRQVVMDPPSKRAPIGTVVVAGGIPGHADGRRRPLAPASRYRRKAAVALTCRRRRFNPCTRVRRL